MCLWVLPSFPSHPQSIFQHTLLRNHVITIGISNYRFNYQGHQRSFPSIIGQKHWYLYSIIREIRNLVPNIIGQKLIQWYIIIKKLSISTIQS